MNYKLAQFFQTEYGALRAYVNSRIADSTDRDAEDIIQDVALKLFSRVDHITPINNIAAFVYSSVRNKIIDVMRAKKARVDLDEEFRKRLAEFAGLLQDHTEMEYTETVKASLKEAIRNLKPIYRDVILAIDFEGLTYKEFSLETGISAGTLMSRRHRALSILFKELQKTENSNNKTKTE
ncbi:RNA polymerase sigma factor [Poritiphilus flavus]|nr:RNA polymerase sigma factor [Poritiphilus flavus]